MHSELNPRTVVSLIRYHSFKSKSEKQRNSNLKTMPSSRKTVDLLKIMTIWHANSQRDAMKSKD